MHLLRSLFWTFAPTKVRHRLNPPYASLSYSQEGEDRVLARLLGDSPQPGFFVDVGAFHPMEYSNTYAFYRKGWSGINIDARPGSMDAFKQLRPRDINLEVAISDRPEVLTYYEFNAPALNGFCKETAMKANGVHDYKIIGTREIKTVTLAEVLDQHLPKGQTIDFMDVDVEGLDEQVLKSNNWEKYRPRLILAEAIGLNSLARPHDCPLVPLLGQHGYDLVSKTMNTLIFRRRD